MRVTVSVLDFTLPPRGELGTEGPGSVEPLRGKVGGYG